MMRLAILLLFGCSLVSTVSHAAGLPKKMIFLFESRGEPVTAEMDSIDLKNFQTALCVPSGFGRKSANLLYSGGEVKLRVGSQQYKLEKEITIPFPYFTGGHNEVSFLPNERACSASLTADQISHLKLAFHNTVFPGEWLWVEMVPSQDLVQLWSVHWNVSEAPKLLATGKVLETY